MNGFRLGILPEKPPAIWRDVAKAPERKQEGGPPVIVRQGTWPQAGSGGLLFLAGHGFRMRPRFQVAEVRRERELVLKLEDGLLEGWTFALALHRLAPRETLVVRSLSGDPDAECSPWHLVGGKGERERLTIELADALDRAILRRVIPVESPGL